MASTSIFTQPTRRDLRPAVQYGREVADRGLAATHCFLGAVENRAEVDCALRIRAVENALYDLFGMGKLHGTIHTCIGQEFSGAMLSKHLRANDFVTSNHRCHGHFIGATGDWRGLIDELVGNKEGVCAGIGSSQHLWATNFMSNGQQGGLLPVAAGVALDRKMKNSSNVVFSYLGEGTLGEGIVYETLNLDALWDLPHVVICENNFYSQSTAQHVGVSGTIAQRAAGFSVASATADTWDLPAFDAVLAEACERARVHSQPTFIALATYRLNPHSKGDDTRDKTEIDWFRQRDPATLAVRDYEQHRDRYKEFVGEAAEAIEYALDKVALEPTRYFLDQLPRTPFDETVRWTALPASSGPELRVAQQLNAFYMDWFARDQDAFFLGEDIEDPYGGAFKISKGMSSAYGPRVQTTPISEAAITGVGIGLALCGRRAFVEIMFGDFITYAFDQIVNNASKIFHMYNQMLDCPVIIRTPMGGRRGYGPTHSQSLERFLIGIDNCCAVSLNSLVPVEMQIVGIEKMRCPVLLIENKSDYTVRTFVPADGFVVKSDGGLLPTLRVHTENARSTLTVLAYGGMARFIANSLIEIFERTDVVPELIVPVGLSPINLNPIAESLSCTGRLLVVEEGPSYGSVGGETIAQLHERPGLSFVAARVGGKATPIPSAPSLEAAALPSVDEICVAISALMERA